MRAIRSLAVILGWLISSAHADDISINYKISFPEAFNGCLQIASIFTLNDSGEIVLQAPSSGISTINVTAMGQVSFKQGVAANTYVINSEPNKKIKAEYAFCPQNSSQILNRPLVSDDLIYFVPYTAMLWPLKQDHNIWNINLEILNKPNNFKIYSPLNIKNCKATANLMGSVFLNTPIFSGDNQLVTLSRKNFTVHFILRGNLRNFPENYYKDFFKIMNYQRKFWDEEQKETNYVLINAKNQASYQIGNHPEHVVVLNYWPTSEYETGLHAFAHENFHDWLGRKIKFPSKISDLQWLMEGMTDYFGLALARESGVMLDKIYINNINRVIAKYYLSPIHDVSNDQMSQNVLASEIYQTLAQNRGHLSALQFQPVTDDIRLEQTPLARAIKNLPKSLRDDEIRVVSRADINQSFSSQLGVKDWKKFQKLLNGEQPIKLPKKCLSGKATLILTDMQIPCFGLDLIALLENHQIKNLQKDSPEFLAGLREGDNVLGHNLRLFNVDETSEIYIKTFDQRVRTIRFFAKISNKKIPQYSISDKD